MDFDNEFENLNDNKKDESYYIKKESLDITAEKIPIHENTKELKVKTELEKAEEDNKKGNSSNMTGNPKGTLGFNDFTSNLKSPKSKNRSKNMDNSDSNLNEIELTCKNPERKIPDMKKKYNAEFEIVKDFVMPTSVKQIIKSHEGGTPLTYNNYKITKRDKTLLSLCDHLCLAYLPCCISLRTQNVKKYYDKVINIVKEYTDILNITNNIFEVEKLKYLLMDEDQAAVFNYRSKVEISKKTKKDSKFNNFYYFLKELNDSVDVNQIKKELMERDTQKRHNNRLCTLFK